MKTLTVSPMHGLLRSGVMKRVSPACVVLACVMLSSAASGITAGPGGKVYFLAHNASTGYQQLSSLVVGADWTSSATDNQMLGTIADFSSNGNDFTRSPEIMVSGGRTGWATLGIGAGYNATPAAGLMDLLKVQTYSGGNTVTVLGDGRATGTGNTSTKLYGLLDHSGSFSGHADSFVVSNATNQYACWDNDASGDITDGNGDYHPVGRVLSYTNDAEILGPYMFAHTSYFSSTPGLNIGMVKNNGGTFTNKYWYTNRPATPMSPCTPAAALRRLT